MGEAPYTHFCRKRANTNGKEQVYAERERTGTGDRDDSLTGLTLFGALAIDVGQMYMRRTCRMPPMAHWPGACALHAGTGSGCCCGQRLCRRATAPQLRRFEGNIVVVTTTIRLPVTWRKTGVINDRCGGQSSPRFTTADVCIPHCV